MKTVKKDSAQYRKMKIAEAKKQAATVKNDSEPIQMSVDEAKTIIANSKINNTVKHLLSNYTDEMWNALINLAEMNNAMFERVTGAYEPNSDISQKMMFRVWLRISFDEITYPIDVITHLVSLYLSTPPKCISKSEMLELASDTGHLILENMNSIKKEGDMVYFSKEQFTGKVTDSTVPPSGSMGIGNVDDLLRNL